MRRSSLVAFVVFAFVALSLATLPSCLALQTHDGPWPCQSDADCDVAGTHCKSFTAGGLCVATNYCVTDADCPKGVCDTTANACATPPCATDADCSPYRCALSKCSSSCAADADCSAGFSCVDGACEVPPCTNDAECGRYACNGGQCLSACTESSSCAEGSVCVGGACVAAPACDNGGSGQCNGLTCTNGFCPSRCQTSGCDRGLLCAADGTCQCDSTFSECNGYVCRGTACLTKCATDGDCRSGLMCSPNGTCMQCTGSPPACGTVTQCTTIRGCATASTCSGLNFNCSVFDNDGPGCAANGSCSWNDATGSCSGSASCSGEPLGSCGVSDACTLTIACGGTATPCAELTYAQCSATSGCSVQPLP